MTVSKFDDSRIISFPRFLLNPQPQAFPFRCSPPSSYLEVVVVLFGIARASRVDLLGWCADRHFWRWNDHKGGCINMIWRNRLIFLLLTPSPAWASIKIPDPPGSFWTSSTVMFFNRLLVCVKKIRWWVVGECVNFQDKFLIWQTPGRVVSNRTLLFSRFWALK